MSDVVVVGGGIVGTVCAGELLARGLSVTVIERDEPGAGTSAGSAGYLSDGEIFPLAQPGVPVRILPMLADPQGPLVVRPAYLPRMIGWGTRFLLASRSRRFQAGIRAMSSLNRVANDMLFAFAKRAGAERYLVRDGCLHVAYERATLEHAEALVATLEANGIAARIVDASSARAMEPNLSASVLGGVFYPNAARCTDPFEFGRALAGAFRAGGGTVVRAAAQALVQRAPEQWIVRTSEGEIEAPRVLVAAGVWSRELVQPLGYRVPLEAARGYHLMLPEPGVQLARTLLFEETHFCATPMDRGLRLAGTVEFAGVDAAPDYRRSEMLLGLAARYLPGIRGDGATRWMGSRPSFPDSLPALGAAPRHQNLYFAFGQEKLGLTQSAVTATCVADVILGRKPPLDLTPFSLGRF